MRTIDGDKLAKLLRKYGMNDAAELTELMPTIGTPRRVLSTEIIADFLTSKANVQEVSSELYTNRLNCYNAIRAALIRKNITNCYCYMEHGRIYLARVQRRGDDGKTTNIRN